VLLLPADGRKNASGGQQVNIRQMAHDHHQRDSARVDLVKVFGRNRVITGEEQLVGDRLDTRPGFRGELVFAGQNPRPRRLSQIGGLAMSFRVECEAGRRLLIKRTRC